jgi:hypothetical protein
MRTLESSAASRQEALHPTWRNRREEPQCVDGAGIIYGLLLGSVLWLVGLTVVLLIW